MSDGQSSFAEQQREEEADAPAFAMRPRPRPDTDADEQSKSILANTREAVANMNEASQRANRMLAAVEASWIYRWLFKPKDQVSK